MMLLSAALLSSLAIAATADYCAPLAKLKPQITDCSRNSYYAKAALNCVAKIDEQANGVHRVLLQGGLSANGAASTSAQKEKLANAQADVSSALVTADRISLEITEARAEMLRYIKNFAWPGRLSDAQVAALGIASELATIPCYSNNEKIVEQQVSKLESRAADIARSNAELHRLGGGISRGSSALGSQAGGGVRGTSGAGSGAMENLSGDRTSNVTGHTDEVKLPSP